MSVSREYLARCSAASGYDANSLEKVIRLGELAGDISKHGLLGECLALKGGTALDLRSRLNWPSPHPDDDRASRLLAEHPALAWKLANVRRYRGKQGT